MVRDMHKGTRHVEENSSNGILPLDGKKTGEFDDVVLSSRVRFARNMGMGAFPGWDDQAGRLRVLSLVRKTLQKLGAGKGWLPWEKMSDEERMRMQERHWVSREMVESPAETGVWLSEDKRVSMLVNEEDHLRIQGIVKGCDLRGAWRLARDMDDALGSQLEFAYSGELGYLTACPSNVGSGMRASVMVHLAGLALTGEIDGAIRGLERMGYAVRGVSGEDSESAGEVFQVSNAGTLGTPGQKVLEDLEEVAEELVRQERWARQFLREEDSVVAEDCVARALAAAGAARLMTTSEGMAHLSAVRLGVAAGFVGGATLEALDEMMARIQPAHLAHGARDPRVLEEGRETLRDMCRAELMRAFFKPIHLKLATVKGRVK